MHGTSEKYEAIPRTSSSDEIRDIASFEPRRSRKSYVALLALTLVLSLATNLVLAVKLHDVRSSCRASVQYGHTTYVGLENNQPIAYEEDTPYTDHNETAADATWEALSIDVGVVALGDDWVKEKGLPPAQRFPWDHSKGIYVLSAYHSLHCIVCACFPYLISFFF
jgi:hypothetical protein